MHGLRDEVKPAAQVTTASYVDAGAAVTALENRGVINTRGALVSVSFTIAAATASAKWRVLASNDPDFAASKVVSAEATLASGASDGYAETLAAYSYYKVQVTDGSGHATVTVHGIAKG